MKREIDGELVAWKKHPKRMPLIVRGARQVGKSFSVESFGKEHFDTLVLINFESDPELHECFATQHPEEICRKIELGVGKKIIPGRTLLFLDEIQHCQKAITALRYFKEKMPELHVIAAGSLLEFILEDEEFSFPVGRIQFLNMTPLSFVEYLTAIGKGHFIEELERCTLEKPPPQFFHEELLKRVTEYFLIGGMPAAIDVFKETNSYLDVLRLQKAIHEVYQLDFGKYAKKIQHHYLQKLYERAPEMTAKHFKFSKIDPEAPNPARDYKIALKKLGQARILHLVHATHANGLPLRAEKDEKTFKILFLDIGLLQSALGGHPERFLNASLHQINQGVLAEQFVGQELLAYQDPYLEHKLYFWEKQAAGSSAEIDFVINQQGIILPIKVKAGATGRLKSLKQFLEKKPANIGLRIYEGPLSFEDNILSVPFYLISQLPRLLGNKC